MRRSMLFLPGNTPNMLINGDALGADCIILDLEDAVAPDQKDAARLLVCNAIGEMGFEGCEVTVRINSLETDYWKDDLDAIIPLRPDMIMPRRSAAFRMFSPLIPTFRSSKQSTAWNPIP